MTDRASPLPGQPSAVAVPWVSVVKIWWLMTWRATLGSILTGAIVGVIVGVIGLISGWPASTRTIVTLSLGAIIGVAWHVVAVRMALDKRYSDFRLTIAPLP